MEVCQVSRDCLLAVRIGGWVSVELEVGLRCPRIVV